MRVNDLLQLEREHELNIGDDKKYKFKAICNSEIYVKEAIGQVPKLYYFVTWKDFTEKKAFKS